jgi:hypothetical protein
MQHRRMAWILASMFLLIPAGELMVTPDVNYELMDEIRDSYSEGGDAATKSHASNHGTLGFQTGSLFSAQRKS